MKGLLTTTLLGFLAGSGATAAGGLLIILFESPDDRIFSWLLGFSGGIMIAITSFNLLPEAIEIGGLLYALIGFTTGTFLIIFIDVLTSSFTVLSGKESIEVQFIKAGSLMGLGIAMHNFPEGLAIGSGFASAESYGISLALLITLHNMPEGLAMAAPLKIGRLSKASILLYTFMAGLPMGLGSFIGTVLGYISPMLISACLGFAGGAMLYITCGELLPDTVRFTDNRGVGLGVMVGTVTGIIMSYLL